MVVIVILGVIFIPKLIFNRGGNTVKFKILEDAEVPQKIEELLPRYKAEERALACKYNEDIYIIVTRGEKRTQGYTVTIDRLEKVKRDDGKFDLVVYAKYRDPKPDEVVAQVITYPYVVAISELKEMPETIKLEVEYID